MKNNKMIVFSGLGMEMVAIIVGSVWLGQELDTRWHLNGLGTIILLLAGVCGWVIHLVVLLKNFNSSPE